MTKNDLALKGNLDGVELLIFSSNQLPENSQRKTFLNYYLFICVIYQIGFEIVSDCHQVGLS